MEHDVEIKMIADVTDLKKQVANVTKDMGNLEKQIGRTGKATTFSAITQGLQMVERYGKQVIAVMKDLVNTFAEASRESTTWNIMMEHSKFSQEEIDSLKAYSSELQNYTGISDEAISNTERLLLSATDLTKDGLIRATNACADLSKAMGTDITGSAQTLAIALASPAEGLSRLRRSGILFTDEEEALIKKLEESGDVLKAQDIMLSKIEERYGGIAKAIGDTPIGTLDKIKETWGDIKENLGESILNSVSPALNMLLDTLNAIKQWQEETQRPSKTQEVFDIFKNPETYQGEWDDKLNAMSREQVQNAFEDLSVGTYKLLEKRLEAYRDEIESTGFDFSNINNLISGETEETIQWLLSALGISKETTDAIIGLQREHNINSDVLAYLDKFLGIKHGNYEEWTEEEEQAYIDSIQKTARTMADEMEQARKEYEELLATVEKYNKYANHAQAEGDEAMANYWANKAKAVQNQIDQLITIAQEANPYADMFDDADELEQGDASRKHNRFTAWADELDKLTGSEKINALINFREEIGKVLAALSGEDKDDAVRALEEINASLTEMVDNVLGYALPVVTSFGEALGETLAGGEDAWKGFGRTAINSIAQVIEACGQEAIAVATKDLIASKFLDSTAWAGLAKGAGIVALAGTVRGLARFERGGIVGGTGITGDSRLIRANAGELILTRAQQNSIANQLQSGGRATQINVAFNGTVLGDQQSVSAWVYDGIERAKYNGVI